MIDILETASQLRDFCDRQGWQSCIMGEPRATRDVNVALLTGFGDEDGYIETLLDRYRA